MSTVNPRRLLVAVIAICVVVTAVRLHTARTRPTASPIEAGEHASADSAGIAQSPSARVPLVLPASTVAELRATADALPPGATRKARPADAGASVFERASALVVNGDPSGARALLEPRVWSGHAPNYEVMLLLGTCEAQHDQGCQTAIRQNYPTIASSSPGPTPRGAPSPGARAPDDNAIPPNE